MGLSPPRTAALLVVGNEILSGKIVEANVAPLATLLRSLGIALRRIVTVPDEVDVIAADENTAAEIKQRLVKGFLGLQNHSEEVWFRNLLIRRL